MRSSAEIFAIFRKCPSTSLTPNDASIVVACSPKLPPDGTDNTYETLAPEATGDTNGYETVEPTYIVPIGDDNVYMMIDDVTQGSNPNPTPGYDDIQINTNRV